MHDNTGLRKTDPFGNITYGSLSSEEITPFVQESTLPITIETIGITHSDPKYFISRKHNDYYIFEYVISGKGHVVNNGNHFEVNAGDVYILEEGSQHRYWADEKEPYEKIFINVYGKILGDILKAYSLSGVTVFPNSGCEQYFDMLLQTAKNNSFSDAICYEVACILFRIINKLAERRTAKAVHSSLAKNVKQMLDGYVYSNISIEAIANELNVSKVHIINKFTEAYGVTPYKYYQERKMESAKYLLGTTTMRICEISDSLGYSDEHYFSNVFKEKTGYSPNAYRKAVKNNEL